MIRIEQLQKTFQDGARSHAVLRGLDLEVEPGQFMALLGRSGSGKSTLLNCIAGIERPDSGRIFVGDTELGALDDRALTQLRRDRIGIIFQFFNLLPTLPVLENVALPALLRGDSRKAAHARAMELLEELELADRASERPDHLSGGEQQRVATARALVNRPLVLLADEPTGNLDAATGERTLQLLKQVNEKHGVTVIMVTHSREAASVATRIGELKQGRVVDAEPEAEAKAPDAPEAAEPAEGAEAAKPTSAAEAAKPTGDAPKARPSAKAAALFQGKKDDAPAEAEAQSGPAPPAAEAPPEPQPTAESDDAESEEKSLPEF